jgi:TolB-like protein
VLRSVVAAVTLSVGLVVLAPAAHAARTIAIVYFDNDTGKPELDPLRKGLADMLITDLSNVATLQIVERDRLNQVLGELKLSRSAFVDPASAQKLGKGLAAEFLMAGSYIVAGDDLRVDVRVIEVATGRVVAPRNAP